MSFTARGRCLLQPPNEHRHFFCRLQIPLGGCHLMAFPIHAQRFFGLIVGDERLAELLPGRGKFFVTGKHVAVIADRLGMATRLQAGVGKAEAQQRAVARAVEQRTQAFDLKLWIHAKNDRVAR